MVLSTIRPVSRDKKQSINVYNIYVFIGETNKWLPSRQLNQIDTDKSQIEYFCKLIMINKIKISSMRKGPWNIYSNTLQY